MILFGILLRELKRFMFQELKISLVRMINEEVSALEPYF